ncbi:hypothetical protein [Segniliparus rugosus]|uniref:Uncharacterized protein n=1 Tax=Segniliparus rugosus (strain ATCC BAA-974 / DSM 45345 / CCUG 50838 / CIP 108380 / JCM 13579 / CDC 945) TaxID=679197 RepID=E5XSG2_SEGRC|nr:hypothetical protein [Segniliparus rugosus]EFV12712.1 hypothetical protein HMPREF9336_02434 [Segniliparus rugosus ATCC BAA-974]
MTTDLVFQLLAVGPPGPEQGKGSPWGVVITLFLVIAVFLLGWSMQKHLKKLPKSFDDPEAGEQDEAEEGQKPGR